MLLTMLTAKQDAQDLLSSLEDASAKVGLLLNAKKTDYMCINGEEDHTPIVSRDGTKLKEVDDFKFLGLTVICCRKQERLSSRKAQA